jgi:protein-tyrosine-phosphatase
MADAIYNVLFLCTHNSARSILAEASLNGLGEGRFRGYSAGSFPSGRINPLAIELLVHLGHPVDTLYSKSWDDFADGPQMDFVITVCDQAAGEVCPVWPGMPVVAHWGLPDPSAIPGTDEQRKLAFRRTYLELQNHIRSFISLPIDKLDRLSLKRKLDEIGRTRTE